MSKLPIPKNLKNGSQQNCESNSLPFPILHPSDSWLASHKEIIYDTTENWEKSELRLRLGTVAINYNISNELSDSTFGVKVAFKDRYGNPQIWRTLPYIRPDLTPTYIEEIAQRISAYLSVEFATRPEFYSFAADVSAAINELSVMPIDADRLVQENPPLFLNCGTATVVIDAKDNLKHINKEN